MPHPRKCKSQIKKPTGYQIFITPAILVYCFHSLYGPNLCPVLNILLPWQLRILTPHSEQPTSTIFCAFSFECHYCTFFWSYNKTFSCFNFFQHSLLSSKVFPLFSILFFYMTLLLWNIIFKTSGKISSLTHTLQKCCQ